MSNPTDDDTCEQPNRTGSPASEDGVVLLLILVIIVMTISSVYAFSRSSLLEVMSSRQRTLRVRAELLSRSGIEIAKRTLLDDLHLADDLVSVAIESPWDPWRILSRIPIEVSESGTLTIRIQDSGSRINLNAMVDEDGQAHGDSEPFLVAALERIIEHMPGREEDKPYEPKEVAEAILDWLDKDDQTRLGDDEGAYYAGLDEALRLPDRPLFTLDELATIPDMDGLLLEALKAYFTVQPMFPDIEKSGVNPNTAPAHILGLIYHGTAQEKLLLDRDEVFRILTARSKDKVFCAAEYGQDCESFAELTGLVGESFFPPLRYTSDIFTIRSEARYDTVRSCTTAVVDRGEASETKTLFYRIGC